MGKSPGKWIKTVLFGKKSSKSSFSKKAAVEKEAFLAAKGPSADLAVGPPFISDPAPPINDRIEENPGLENGISTGLPHDAVVLLSSNGYQNRDARGTTEFSSPHDVEICRQEQAATKVQAAFRGYLALRAFRALKGIIRLQALVRGHLVRRQAVATLRSVRGIVKLQALVRGQSVRGSDAGFEVYKRCAAAKPLDAKQVDSIGTIRTPPEKLSANVFVTKLLDSSPTPMPLKLQYDPAEANSAWSWGERWSASQFWGPLKKVDDTKSQKKQDNNQCAETEPGKPKRGVRRASGVNSDNSSSLSTSRHENPKRNIRKSYGHQSEPTQANSQNELERVKRSLRKISLSTTDPNDKPEVVAEKPKHGVKKVSSSQAPDVPLPVIDDTSEKTSNPSPTVEIPKLSLDLSPKALVVNEPVDVIPDDHTLATPDPVENGGNDDNVLTVNTELSSKEDQTSNENQRARRRRSFPVKQEYPENGSQNSPTIPSYMAATESAKAKLKGLGSPGLGQNGADNGFVRRHSLPSSANGKANLLSPRMQRLVQATGKGETKNEKSLLSSRDAHEKVPQAEWRR